MLSRNKVVASVLSAAVLAAAGYLGIAPEAVQITKESEGRVLTVYKDPVNISTVCDGHTRTGLVQGKTYTHAECDAFLVADLGEALKTVDSCITAPLTPQQRGALGDFALNVGPGKVGVKDGLCKLKGGRTPTIATLFNQRRYAEACREFPKWNLQKLPGIDIRRKKEMDLCLRQ